METYRDQVKLRLAAKDELCKLAGMNMLYALVDACDEPDVPRRASSAGEARARSLYQGAAAAKYKSIAPYLFQADAGLIEWIAEFRDKPWGVYATSKSDLAGLSRHFRSMLEVRDPAGKQLYFRFYDPRVLETYLTLCTDGELRRFYGPVLAYGLSGPGPGECTFRVSNRPAPEPYSIAQIQVRQEQMDLFGAKIEREVEDRTVERIKETRSGELGKMSDADLRRRVSGHLKDGRQYGMTHEATLARYADYKLRLDLAKAGR